MIPSQPVKAPENFNLSQLASEFLRIDDAFNYSYGKIFSIVTPSVEQLVEFLQNLKLTRASVPNNYPVDIVVGDFSKLVDVQAEFVPWTKEGKLNLQYTLSKRQLPSCMYLAIISVAPKKDKSTNYAGAIEAISFVRTLLSLHFGKLVSYTWIADFEFDSKGKVSFPGEVIRRPLYADLARIIDVQLANEIMARLAHQQSDFRHRFHKACNFVSNALNQKDEAFRFSSYWIALEVLVGGKSGAIKSKLTQAYGKRRTAFADIDLCFKEIEKVRNNLIHHGTFTTLLSYHERLLQLYFWDIVIHQIGLTCRELSRSLVLTGLIEEERESSKETNS
jgi:hypothetical protein